MSQTDPLTELQRRRIRRYMEREWSNLHFSSNKKECVGAVRALYEAQGLEEPEIFWLPSPIRCADKMRHPVWSVMHRLPEDKRESYRSLTLHRPPIKNWRLRAAVLREIRRGRYARNDLRLQLYNPIVNWIAELSRQSLGWWQMPYNPTHCYRQIAYSGALVAAGFEFTSRRDERIAAWAKLAQIGFLFWLERGKASICKPPKYIRRDMNQRLHYDKGPAVQFADGSGLYYWHGVNVPKLAVLYPKQITLPLIQVEPNLEVRRVMIERYGIDKFFEKSGARCLNRGSLGELWQITFPAPTPRFAWQRRVPPDSMRIVKVINSTAEPDGTHKAYFLQVPMTVQTADDAVAWTFGFRSARRYKKALQEET